MQCSNSDETDHRFHTQLTLIHIRARYSNEDKDQRPNPLLATTADGDLECLPRVHLVQSLLVVLEVEDVGNHAICSDPARVEVGDGTGETVSLRERSNDADLITEDLGRRPRDASLVLVNTIHEE